MDTAMIRPCEHRYYTPWFCAVCSDFLGNICDDCGEPVEVLPLEYQYCHCWWRSPYKLDESDLETHQ